MQATRSAADLQAAFQEPGCCICRLLARDEQHYFEALLYEQVNDPGVRDELRATRGFCAAHVQALMTTPNAPFGSAIIYHDLLQTLQANLPERIAAEPAGALAALRSAFGNGGDRDAVAGGLRGAGMCPACRRFNDLARIYAETLLAILANEQVGAAYEHSAGLCLPHLLLALRQGGSEPALGRLLATQIAAWRQLDHELTEFIRKHDYRFRDEGLETREQDVWRRALQAIAGKQQGHDAFDART